MKNKGLDMIEAGKALNEVEMFLESNKGNILTLVSSPDEELDDEFRYVFIYNGKISCPEELVDCILIGFENMIAINPDGTIDVYPGSDEYKEMGFVDGDYIIKSSPDEIKAFKKCMNIKKYNK